MHTPDLTAENIEKLAALFPDCVTEAKDEATGKLKRAIDFDQLRQELSDHIVEGPRERYHLDWPGKREALLAANAPIAKTLRPCREESVEFDTTKNLFIEGDNLDALKLLQETYLGKVRMIYIDPPYNTGSDLLYDDDFGQTSPSFLIRSNQKDELSNRLVANPETNGRFHSDWLSMIYPRLKLARTLLADDGVIFVSVGDGEVSNLQKVCSEIFGEENCVSLVPRIAKRTSDKGTHFRPTKDFVLVYARDIAQLPEFGIQKVTEASDYKLVGEDGRNYKKSGASLYQPSLDSRPNQRYYIEAPDGSLIIPPGTVFPEVKADASMVKPQSNSDKVWRWSVDTYRKQKHLLIFTEGSSKNPLLDEHGKQSKWNIYPKVFLDEDTEATLHPEDVIYDYPNSQGTKELKSISIPFSFAKPSGLVAFLLNLINDNEALVVDFFCGSATTADAVMQLNAKDGGQRRFIMVQLPEVCDSTSEAYKEGFQNITQIGRERIRRAGAKIKADNATIAPNLDTGFRVLKIDTSNMADVYYAPDALKQADLVAHTDNIKADRTPEDLLFQVLVDWGVDLTLPITQEQIADKTVFFVDGNALAACFDSKVSEDLVKELAKRKPLRVVFRDSSFDSDSTKINVEQIFKLLSPETEVKSL